jgi:hypothetical protein
MRQMFTVERQTPNPSQVQFVLVDHSTGAGRALCCGSYDLMHELKEMLEHKLKKNPKLFSAT